MNKNVHVPGLTLALLLFFGCGATEHFSSAKHGSDDSQKIQLTTARTSALMNAGLRADAEAP